jgi:hypothetical protein
VAADEPDFAAEGLLKGLRGKQREARPTCCASCTTPAYRWKS